MRSNAFFAFFCFSFATFSIFSPANPKMLLLKLLFWPWICTKSFVGWGFVASSPRYVATATFLGLLATGLFSIVKKNNVQIHVNVKRSYSTRITMKFSPILPHVRLLYKLSLTSRYCSCRSSYVEELIRRWDRPNVNFLRRYRTYFKILKKRTYFV